MVEWTNIMNYGLNVLKICAVGIFLQIGTAFSDPAANKPYKVCPLVVTVKDVPCRVPKPTAAITHRLEIPVTNDIKQLEEENKMLRKIIEELTDAKSTN
jgi:hypothetical protein